jgi:hypothetical protein
MRIAFDLDDTLIPSSPDRFPVERPGSWLGRLFAAEPLRLGAPALLRGLTTRGCEVWVYTTSLRPLRYIRRLFRWYGVRLGGAINQETHWEWLQRQTGSCRCSKYPPAFGISLLVDDSEGVGMEGEQFNFRVVVVRPDDVNWVEKVIAAVGKLLALPATVPAT